MMTVGKKRAYSEEEYQETNRRFLRDCRKKMKGDAPFAIKMAEFRIGQMEEEGCSDPASLVLTYVSGCIANMAGFIDMATAPLGNSWKETQIADRIMDEAQDGGLLKEVFEECYIPLLPEGLWEAYADECARTGKPMDAVYGEYRPRRTGC